MEQDCSDGVFWRWLRTVVWIIYRLCQCENDITTNDYVIDERWIGNYLENRLWLIQGTITAFLWRDWKSTKNNSWCFSRNCNQTPPKYKHSILPLRQHICVLTSRSNSISRRTFLSNLAGNILQLLPKHTATGPIWRIIHIFVAVLNPFKRIPEQTLCLYDCSLHILTSEIEIIYWK
jgi:hypothetical protein